VKKLSKFMAAMVSAVIVLLILLVALPALAGDSKYQVTTSGTTAAVTFGPASSGAPFTVRGLSMVSDKTDSVLKFYARGGAGRVAPTTSPTNGATVILIANSTYGFTNSDHVVYAHANGVVDKTTVSSCTTTSITLAAAITAAGATGDGVYELTQQYQIPCGTSAVNLNGGYVYSTPSDSPLYLLLDCGTNGTLSVTTDR
jgi:hypothetical protein